MSALPYDDDTLDEWTRLMLRANSLLDRGAFDSAVAAYRLARRYATEHFGSWPDVEDAVTALVVSSLNLAEGLVRVRRLPEAAATLCGAHGGMLHAARDERLPMEARLAARKRLRETRAALLRFQSQHGPWPEVQRWLAAGCACGSPAHAQPAASHPSPTLH
ncbi:hypothetical protein [Piscinibacter sp.]|uniref:hypothetical protein n=1 Tax=Piscinibacter sp. TaxID=1903157 RepID=UPI0039E67DA0